MVICGCYYFTCKIDNSVKYLRMEGREHGKVISGVISGDEPVSKTENRGYASGNESD